MNSSEWVKHVESLGRRSITRAYSSPAGGITEYHLVFSHVYKLRTTIPVSGFWGAIWMQTPAPEYTQILVIGS
jgi:hypothetical protein